MRIKKLTESEIINERINNAIEATNQLSPKEIQEIGLSKKHILEMMIGIAKESTQHSKKVDINYLTDIMNMEM